MQTDFYATARYFIEVRKQILRLLNQPCEKNAYLQLKALLDFSNNI